MNEQGATIEEVTTIDNGAPQQTVRKFTKQSESQAHGDVPQKVYEKKKTIFRSNQIIWYILGVVEVLLVFRLVLHALGANSYVGFTSLIYSITTPLVTPFNGILGTTVAGSSIFEWSTIIAAIVYICIAWGLVYLLNLIYPITPKDV